MATGQLCQPRRMGFVHLSDRDESFAPDANPGPWHWHWHDGNRDQHQWRFAQLPGDTGDRWHNHWFVRGRGDSGVARVFLEQMVSGSLRRSERVGVRRVYHRQWSLSGLDVTCSDRVRN